LAQQVQKRGSRPLIRAALNFRTQRLRVARGIALPHCSMYRSCSSAVRVEYCSFRAAPPPPAVPTGPLLEPRRGVTGADRLASACAPVVPGEGKAREGRATRASLPSKPLEVTGEAVSSSPPPRQVRGRGSAGGDAGESSVRGDAMCPGAWLVPGLGSGTAADSGGALLANGEDRRLCALWLPVPSSVETEDAMLSPVRASSCRPRLLGGAWWRAKKHS
jgi:hypothetical protein